MPAARASTTSWESSATACVGREGDVGTASERGTDIGYTVEDAGVYCQQRHPSLIEPVEALDGSIEGLGVDVVVGDGIEMSIGDLHIAGTFLGEDGVALNDEGITQFVAYIVPQTGCGIVEEISVGVVVDGIGNTQIVMHQRRHKIQMGGTMLEDD